MLLFVYRFLFSIFIGCEFRITKEEASDFWKNYFGDKYVAVNEPSSYLLLLFVLILIVNIRTKSKNVDNFSDVARVRTQPGK